MPTSREWLSFEECRPPDQPRPLVRPDALQCRVPQPVSGLPVKSVAQGQPVIGQTSWGQNALNRIVANWPAVAIVVLVAVLLLGVLGFYRLDGPRAVLLLTAIGFLVYLFYWEPLSQMLPR